MPTVGSLFSGIGGLDLGLERAGWEVKWQIENDEWCTRVLAKHWPDVPRYGDVKEVSGYDLEAVDLIAGGFPCQPVSVAGKRKAQADPRWLWPEFLRIVSEVRPRFVLVENVPGLLHRGMAGVVGDLSSCGYDVEWDCIPAAAVGAPHLRYRVFIVAYSSGSRRGTGEPGVSRQSQPDPIGRSEDVADSDRSGWDGGPWVFGPGGRAEPADSSSDVADTTGRGRNTQPLRRSRPQAGDSPSDADGSGTAFRGEDWWRIEPDFRRVVNGVPERLDSGLNGSDRMDTVGGSLAVSEDGVRTLRECWAKVGAASQGRESDKQLSQQLGDALPQVSHDDTLGERKAGMEAAGFVFRLREACSQVGPLSDPRHPLLQAWQSLSEEDQDWTFLAACGGIWLNEWPSVPRIASGVPARVDRLKGLGNAVVPQVAEWIGRRILEATKG